MQSKESYINALVVDSSSIIHQSALVCDITDFKSDLAMLQKQWPMLVANTAQRAAQLSEIGATSNKYQAQLSAMTAWLQLMRDKISWLAPSKGSDMF